MKNLKSILGQDVTLKIYKDRFTLENTLDRTTNGCFSWSLDGSETEADLIKMVKLKAWRYIAHDQRRIVYIASSDYVYTGKEFSQTDATFWNGKDFTALPQNAKRFPYNGPIPELKGQSYSLVALPIFKD